MIRWQRPRPGFCFADVGADRWELRRVNIVRRGRRLKSTVWTVFRNGSRVKDVPYLCDAQSFVETVR